MSYQNPTQTEVGRALANLGNYRVRVAQSYANAEPADWITGELLLCLGLRESWLKNINNPAGTDKGCFQITELYWQGWLLEQVGCPVGEWQPDFQHTAADDDYCPRFTPALRKAVEILHSGYAYAKAKGVPEADRVRVAIAAYNAGGHGAVTGYREGDVDAHTTSGEYSEWVLTQVPKVVKWLDAHPRWRPTD